MSEALDIPGVPRAERLLQPDGKTFVHRIVDISSDAAAAEGALVSSSGQNRFYLEFQDTNGAWHPETLDLNALLVNNRLSADLRRALYERDRNLVLRDTRFEELRLLFRELLSRNGGAGILRPDEPDENPNKRAAVMRPLESLNRKEDIIRLVGAVASDAVEARDMNTPLYTEFPLDSFDAIHAMRRDLEQYGAWVEFRRSADAKLGERLPELSEWDPSQNATLEAAGAHFRVYSGVPHDARFGIRMQDPVEADTVGQPKRFEHIPTAYMGLAYMQDGKLVPLSETGVVPNFEIAKLSAQNVTLHYATSAFEGIRAMRTETGDIVVPNLRGSAARFLRSIEFYLRNEYPDMELPSVDYIETWLLNVIQANEAYIPAHGQGIGYVRPVVFGIDEILGVKPGKRFILATMVDPVSAYLGLNPISVELRNEARTSMPYVDKRDLAGNIKGAFTYPAPIPSDGDSASRGHKALYIDRYRRIAELNGANYFQIEEEEADGVVTIKMIRPRVTASNVLRGNTSEAMMQIGAIKKEEILTKLRQDPRYQGKQIELEFVDADIYSDALAHSELDEDAEDGKQIHKTNVEKAVAGFATGTAAGVVPFKQFAYHSELGSSPRDLDDKHPLVQWFKTYWDGLLAGRETDVIDCLSRPTGEIRDLSALDRNSAAA